jgi:hypothetical protein
VQADGFVDLLVDFLPLFVAGGLVFRAKQKCGHVVLRQFFRSYSAILSHFAAHRAECFRTLVGVEYRTSPQKPRQTGRDRPASVDRDSGLRVSDKRSKFDFVAQAYGRPALRRRQSCDSPYKVCVCTAAQGF